MGDGRHFEGDCGSHAAIQVLAEDVLRRHLDAARPGPAVPAVRKCVRDVLAARTRRRAAQALGIDDED